MGTQLYLAIVEPTENGRKVLDLLARPFDDSPSDRLILARTIRGIRRAGVIGDELRFRVIRTQIRVAAVPDQDAEKIDRQRSS